MLRATVLALPFAGWCVAPGGGPARAGVLTEVLVIDPPAATVTQGATRGFAGFRGPADGNGNLDLGSDGRPGTPDDQFQLVAVSWSVAGGIGTVSPPTGATTIFIATAPGSGEVVGVLGGLQAAADVVVLAAPPTNTRTATRTTTPTHTSTATVTATATNTSIATQTQTDTPTDTPTTAPTQTDTATHTATATDTPLAPATATDTATPTNTPTRTAAPTDTHTATRTPTVTDTPIPAPTATPTTTATPTATPSDTAAPAATSTATLTATATRTAINTMAPPQPPTATQTPAHTPTRTASMGVDLEISKSEEDPFHTGKTGTYRIRVTNVGDTPTTGTITVTDTLPPEIEYVSATGNGWTCPPAPAGPAIVCTHPGPLGPGQSLELLLNARPRLGTKAGTVVVNTAQVSTPGGANPRNDEISLAHPIHGSPDLAIEKTAVGPFVVNGTGTYRIRITNVGNRSYLDRATVIDRLPAGMRFLGARSDAFTCSSTDGLEVECTTHFAFGLPPGRNSEIEIQVAVLFVPVGPVVNEARVQPSSEDPNPANDGPVFVTSEIVEEPAGETPPCGVRNFEGWFEPSQGVWQDDYTFVDLPGKQLMRVTPRIYIAELAMVQNRHSLLFGIHRPVGEPAEDRRNRIVFRGVGDGDDIFVRVRFTLEQGGEIKLLYESERFRAPLGAPCGASRAFEISLDAREGLPPSGFPPFTFDRSGLYRLVAELIRTDGSGTDLKVFVVGQVENTGRLTVHFVPGTFVPLAPEEAQALRDTSDALAALSERRLPDSMPLAPRTVTAPSHAVQDLSAVIARADADPVVRDRRVARREAIRAELTRLMQGGNLLAGADRVAVILAREDYQTVEPEPSLGFADSQKTFSVRAPILGSQGILRSTVDVVQHEIVHTLPFLWTDDEMLRDCKLNWHNQPLPVAHGHRILVDGVVRRERQRDEVGIMGPGLVKKWMSQCAYWHALHQLAALPDPDLHLVQGRVIHDPADPFGELFPLYDVTGDDFAQPGAGGDWAIVLRDAAGASLGRFPFDPRFTVPDVTDAARDLATFAFHVPRFAETARVELVGPGDARLDAITRSPNPPALVITEPRDGDLLPLTNDTVAVRWTATDPDGDEPLPATVLYSDDAGETWQVVAFEQTGASVDLEVSPRRHGHLVRVLVSDGGRSAEHVVGFELDLEARADLTVAQHALPDRAVPGWELEYVLEARNRGPTDASTVVLIDTLPAGTTFVAASPECRHDSGVVGCAIGELRAGRAARPTIVVQVGADTVLPLENVLSIAGAEPDPDPTNDGTTLTTPRVDFGACPPFGVSPAAQVQKGAVVKARAVVCDGAVVKHGARVAAAAVIGENALVGADVRIKTDTRLARDTQLGEDSRLGKRTLLDAGGRLDKAVRVGGASTVGAGAYLEQEVRVGERAAIGARVQLAKAVRAGDDLVIGDGSIIGAGARLGDGVTLGRNVRVGRDARIGDASTIGNDATIAARAIVPPASIIPDGARFP